MATIDSSIVLISLPAIFRAVCLVAAAASWLRGGTVRAAGGARRPGLADLAAGEVPRDEQDTAGPLSRSRAIVLREDA